VGQFFRAGEGQLSFPFPAELFERLVRFSIKVRLS
jgi:hypothetical protein